MSIAITAGASASLPANQTRDPKDLQLWNLHNSDGVFVYSQSYANVELQSSNAWSYGLNKVGSTTDSTSTTDYVTICDISGTRKGYMAYVLGPYKTGTFQCNFKITVDGTETIITGPSMEYGRAFLGSCEDQGWGGSSFSNQEGITALRGNESFPSGGMDSVQESGVNTLPQAEHVNIGDAADINQWGNKVLVFDQSLKVEWQQADWDNIASKKNTVVGWRFFQ